VAVAVLLVILVVALLAGRTDHPTGTAGTGSSSSPGSGTSASTPTPSSTRTSTPSASASADHRVRVDPADYVGRPQDEARKSLEDLGLRVQVTTVDNPGDQQKDTVADVSPSGRVDPGTTITLSVYGDPVKVVVPSPGGKDHGHGNGKGKQ
jgi:serine/threonine-protein kinase